LFERCYQLIFSKHPFRPETKTQAFFLVLGFFIAIAATMAYGGFVFTDLSSLVGNSVFSWVNQIPLWAIKPFSISAAIYFFVHDGWSAAHAAINLGKNMGKDLHARIIKRISGMTLIDKVNTLAIGGLFVIGFFIGGLAGIDGITQFGFSVWAQLIGGFCFAYTYTSQDVPRFFERIFEFFDDPGSWIMPRSEGYREMNQMLKYEKVANFEVRISNSSTLTQGQRAACLKALHGNNILEELSNIDLNSLITVPTI